MKVVANAGPLIALSKLGILHLLPHLYESVLIPSAVYDEVVTHGLDLAQPDAYIVQLAVARRELTVVSIQSASLPETELDSPLHLGERQVIQLALRESPDWVLLDDQLAREQAKQHGLRVKGTLGIIVQAHRHGLITAQEVELIYHAILDRDDIWISDILVQRVRAEWRGGDL